MKDHTIYYILQIFLLAVVSNAKRGQCVLNLRAQVVFPFVYLDVFLQLHVKTIFAHINILRPSGIVPMLNLLNGTPKYVWKKMLHYKRIRSKQE